ncbi:nitroreductase family protein [Lachnoanaerobaculum umeaense]|uniref:Nitroreductase n=1 Tax=Lachnoanaerobaculum umeaense TaxID=617123 RepID=A0A385Q3J9_9FIRM|nr:nitroreductase family protein [Lachnoanaerobaculum umeaense]AYB00270.1 nitroreductase [Lachnoanaerobaculum umeaense]PZW96686.1 nitroreductase [Lachnoanaerobaculum umeaense]
MNYLELIEKRNSIRDFLKKPVEPNKLDEITSFFNSAPKLFDVNTQILIAADEDTTQRLSGVVGYRGNSFNAPAYIVILSEDKDNYLINAGFMAEHLILKIEEMGLSSCFLTSEDSDMLKKVLLINSELAVAAVIAFGYGKKEKDTTKLDIHSPSNVSISSKSGHIAPKIAVTTLAFDTNFNTPYNFDDEYADPVIADALYAASLSPSFLNHQNYRFVINGTHVYLFNRFDEVVTKNDNLLGLGAAMLNFHMILSSKYSGIGNWSLDVSNIKHDFKNPSDYILVAVLDI